MFWVKNANCTPWTATNESIKAGEAWAFDTTVAFEITYSAYFVTPGYVEFKYRKDSLNN